MGDANDMARPPEEDGPIAALRSRGLARRRGERPEGPPGPQAPPGRPRPGDLDAGAWDRACARLEEDVRRWGRELADLLERRADGGRQDAAVEPLLAARDALEVLAWELSYAAPQGDGGRRIRLGRVRVALAALDDEILAHPNAFVAAGPSLARDRSEFRLPAAERDRFWWWYEIPAWAADPVALGRARRRALQRRLAPPGTLPLAADGPKGASGVRPGEPTRSNP